MTTQEAGKVQKQAPCETPMEKLILEDEFLTVDRLVPFKEDAARRSLEQTLTEIEELMRENRWEDIIAMVYPVDVKLPAVVRHGLEVRVRSKAAFALGQIGRFDDAIEELAESLKKEPDSFHLHSSLAYTAYNSLFASQNRQVFLSGKAKTERVELAHRHFKATQALKPDGITNFYREGMLFKKIEDKTIQALPLFETAVANWDGLNTEQQAARHQERKNFIKALYQLSSALLELGKPKQALIQLKRCLGEDKESNHLSMVFKYYALGKINFQLNCFKDARDALLFAGRCRSKEPADFVYELLARTCLAMDDTEKALDAVSKIPENFRRPYFRWTEADVLCARKDFDGAIRALSHSLERDHRSRHKTLIRLVKIEYLLQNYDTAMGHAEAASAFFMEKWGDVYDHGLFWQAVCAFRMEDRAKARQLAQELQDRNPRYPKLDRLTSALDLKRMQLGEGGATDE
ncbi:MAG: tetratricopeptide repeat protein [Desulfobacterales bacterium]|nr:tetratricopeptide repeat protein [Desulfobacterales bacterium]